MSLELLWSLTYATDLVVFRDSTRAAAPLDDGLPLVAMTLGNEPGHSSTGYPTMTMTDGQLTALMGPVRM